MTNTAVKAEIRSAIEQFFRSLDTQDIKLMEQLTPPDTDMVHVGTDTDEIWTGADELKAATREQFLNLQYYRAKIRDLTIQVSRSGDVAWYFHLLDARIRSSGEETVWNGARFTGVLEKRDGDWFLVHTHVSLPED